ncbi:LysR substrate-binding domain-containing protein [Nocardia africana]|uniref:LysR substrate-binding domain-containing protein n=1 Tax=Nocardia africana TaxID=134964 RepID=UPI0007A3C1FA|nr:LysR substrate-binding domain-containing protein [Nocardia africana]MCC3312319.1 hypothetical protein [Nocardia africana]
MRHIELACTAAHLARKISCETQSIQYLLEGIQHGLGVGVLPRAAITATGYGLVAVPLTPALTRAISAATARHHPPTPVTSAFLHQLRERRTLPEGTNGRHPCG